MVKTQIVKLDPDNPDEEKIRFASGLLKNGALVAFSTETVYGLGVNLLDEKAVERLYKIKHRPRNKPLTVHIADERQIERWAKDIPGAAYELIKKFWPGPLTLILKSKEAGKIGIRMPRGKIASSLIRESAVPIGCPSANLSGKPAPGNAENVIKDFNGLIELIIDAGPTQMGIASTVVDLTNSSFKIVRLGAISGKEFQEAGFKFKEE